MNTLLNITPTKAVLKAAAAQEIANALNSTQFYLIQRHNALMRQLWNDPKLTPQEICDGLGTQAGQLFVLGGKTVAFLTDIDPSTINLLEMPTKKFTVAPNGTVTILDEDYNA